MICLPVFHLPSTYLETVRSDMCGSDWAEPRPDSVVIVLAFLGGSWRRRIAREWRRPLWEGEGSLDGAVSTMAAWSFGHAGFHHSAGVAVALRSWAPQSTLASTTPSLSSHSKLAEHSQLAIQAVRHPRMITQ